MTIAYICVAIAGFLPIIFAGISKVGERSFDNNKPRDWIQTQEGYRKRAHWAQLNSFEAFPLFAVAVILAGISGAKPGVIDALAAAFVACRCLYGALYLADKASLRSVVWFFGILCTVALYVMAILASSGSAAH